MVHGWGCNPHHSLWCHWWRQNSETIRDREKRRPPRPMKSSELSNGENRIALRELLQNRTLRHLWRHNLGSRRKLQKIAWENFSIGTFYNITRNQDNPIKTVGRDSFLSPQTQPQGSHRPYILGDSTRPRHITLCPSLIEIGSKTAVQTKKQTNRHYKNNGHLAVNQKLQFIRKQ